MEMRADETLIHVAHKDDGRPRPVFTHSPRKVDQVSIVLPSISPTLDDGLLYDSLLNRAEMGKFQSSVGSTNGTTRQFLVDNDNEATEPITGDDLLFNSIDMLDDLHA